MILLHFLCLMLKICMSFSILMQFCGKMGQDYVICDCKVCRSTLCMQGNFSSFSFQISMISNVHLAIIDTSKTRQIEVLV